VNAKDAFRRVVRQENLPIFLVLLVIIVVTYLVELFGVRDGNVAKVAFLKPLNISNVLLQISTTGILAISMTLIMISGGIDLSVGQMMCFLGTGMAYLVRNQGFSEPAMVLTCVTVAVLCQLSMGWIISRTKLEPFIISLGYMTIYTGLTYLITNGSEITITGKFTFIGQTYVYLTPDFRLGLPVVIYLLLTVIMWLVLKYTKFGRRVYAVGGNEKSARISGVNTRLVVFVVYVISGFLSALGGLTLSARTSAGLPQAGVAYELDAIAAVVIGGTSLSGGQGSLIGTLFGALIIGVINNGLDLLGVSSYYQQVIKGAIIIGAVWLDSLRKGKE